MIDTVLTELRRRVSGEIHTDGGTLAAYASDASNHRVPPSAVAYPRTAEDVSPLVTVCAEAGIPLTSRGAGTNVAGNAIGHGIVIDHSRYRHRIVSIDPVERTAVVEPGVVLDSLQRRAAVHGLRFGPDPSTHNRCTIGGRHQRVRVPLGRVGYNGGLGTRPGGGSGRRGDPAVVEQCGHR